MEETDKADEISLIEEDISEADQDTAEGTELIAGTETKTEETRGENVMHPDLKVPAVEHTYNLRRRRNLRPEYTNIHGLQATTIYCTLTQLSMKRRLKKFKQKGKTLVNAELEQIHRRDEFRPVRTEKLSEKQKHESLALLMFLK